MTIFHQIGHNINQVLLNLDQIFVEAMDDNEHIIIDLNKDQIEHGLGSDGDTLGKYAFDDYADLKQAMGSKAPPGIWDFKLTGSFLDGVYTDKYFGSNLESSGLYIDSRDPKADKLQSMAPHVWGHTDENKTEVQEVVLIDLFKKLEYEITKLR